MQIVRNWYELSKIKPNNKYKLDIDLEMCCGWILPVKEDNNTLGENYFKHHIYLSTHSFYYSQYEATTKLLQEHGFDVKIETIDKDLVKTLKNKYN